MNKSNRKLTLKICLDTASKYMTESDWEKSDYMSYKVAKENDAWFLKCTAHMEIIERSVELASPIKCNKKNQSKLSRTGPLKINTKKTTTKSEDFTLKYCQISASKYKLKEHWKKGEPKAYLAAKENPKWFSLCISHMIILTKKYSLKDCKISASKYKIKRQWEKGDLEAYTVAKGNPKWFKLCTEQFIKYNTELTLEDCKEGALKYSSRTDWAAKDCITYKRAKKNAQWYEECTKHMPEILPTLTLQECMVSSAGFSTIEAWKNAYPKHHHITYRKPEWLAKCIKHMPSPVEISFTFKQCFEDATQYKNKTQWMKHSKEMCKFATTQKWLKKLMFDTQDLDPFGTWTLNKCLKEAGKYNSFHEWRKGSRDSCKVAVSKGWNIKCMDVINST